MSSYICKSCKLMKTCGDHEGLTINIEGCADWEPLKEEQNAGQNTDKEDKR